MVWIINKSPCLPPLKTHPIPIPVVEHWSSSGVCPTSLCVNQHACTHIELSFLIRVTGYIFDKLLFCTENFHLELSPCQCLFLCIGLIVYSCIVVENCAVYFISQILPCSIHQRHTESPITLRNSLLSRPKPKKITWIRQNKILKVVYGVLYLTPKAGVWLRRGWFFLAADEIPGGFLYSNWWDEESGEAGPGASPQGSLKPALGGLPAQFCGGRWKQPFVITCDPLSARHCAISWMPLVTLSMAFSRIPILQVKKLRPKRG